MQVERKHYQILSEHCCLALGIMNQYESKVVLVLPNDQDPCQLWYDEHQSKTIRCKANDLFLQITGITTSSENTLIISQYQHLSDGHSWACSGSYICNEKNKNYVLDISEAATSVGSKIISYPLHYGTNQQWEKKLKARILELSIELLHLSLLPVSQMNRKVLDIDGVNLNAGARLIMYSKKPGGKINRNANQLWYMDENKLIRSALNNFVFDGSNQRQVCLQPLDNHSASKRWTYNQNTRCVELNSANSKVLDILDCKMEECASVGAWSFNGGKNQKWNLDYV